VLLLVFEQFEIELTSRKLVVDGRLWLSLTLLLDNSAIHLSILFVESCEKKKKKKKKNLGEPVTI
jgi:hypothetical protein